MGCVVLEPAVPIRQALMRVLSSLGVTGVPAATVAEAEAAIAAPGGADSIIVDTDTPDLGGMALVERLRASEATRRIRVVAHSGQTTREFILHLADLGAAGYLSRGSTEEQAAERLKQVLARPPEHESERKHLRVRPDPNELLRVHFRLPGHKGVVSGRIVDVSMGGISVELFNPPPPIRMQAGRAIPSLEFALGRRSVSTPGVLVIARGKLCAIRFESIAAPTKDILARYIYRQTAR
jgi:two-component system, chemotaxis family, chemotaxis protein CheY